jgi:hypothetical protein
VQDAVDFRFIQQLRVLGLHRFELNGDLFPGRHVRAQVDVAERPRADLAPEAVFLSYAQLHGLQLLSSNFDFLGSAAVRRLS